VVALRVEIGHVLELRRIALYSLVELTLVNLLLAPCLVLYALLLDVFWPGRESLIAYIFIILEQGVERSVLLPLLTLALLHPLSFQF